MSGETNSAELTSNDQLAALPGVAGHFEQTGFTGRLTKNWETWVDKGNDPARLTDPTLYKDRLAVQYRRVAEEADEGLMLNQSYVEATQGSSPVQRIDALAQHVMACDRSARATVVFKKKLLPEAKAGSLSTEAVSAWAALGADEATKRELADRASKEFALAIADYRDAEPQRAARNTGFRQLLTAAKPKDPADQVAATVDTLLAAETVISKLQQKKGPDADDYANLGVARSRMEAPGLDPEQEKILMELAAPIREVYRQARRGTDTNGVSDLSLANFSERALQSLGLERRPKHVTQVSVHKTGPSAIGHDKGVRSVSVTESPKSGGIRSFAKLASLAALGGSGTTLIANAASAAAAPVSDENHISAPAETSTSTPDLTSGKVTLRLPASNPNMSGPVQPLPVARPGSSQAALLPNAHPQAGLPEAVPIDQVDTTPQPIPLEGALAPHQVAAADASSAASELTPVGDATGNGLSIGAVTLANSPETGLPDLVPVDTVGNIPADPTTDPAAAASDPSANGVAAFASPITSSAVTEQQPSDTPPPTVAVPDANTNPVTAGVPGTDHAPATVSTGESFVGTQTPAPETVAVPNATGTAAQQPGTAPEVTPTVAPEVVKAQANYDSKLKDPTASFEDLLNAFDQIVTASGKNYTPANTPQSLQLVVDKATAMFTTATSPNNGLKPQQVQAIKNSSVLAVFAWKEPDLLGDSYFAGKFTVPTDSSPELGTYMATVTPNYMTPDLSTIAGTEGVQDAPRAAFSAQMAYADASMYDTQGRMGFLQQNYPDAYKTASDLTQAYNEKQVAQLAAQRLAAALQKAREANQRDQQYTPKHGGSHAATPHENLPSAEGLQGRKLDLLTAQVMAKEPGINGRAGRLLVHGLKHLDPKHEMQMYHFFGALGNFSEESEGLHPLRSQVTQTDLTAAQMEAQGLDNGGGWGLPQSDPASKIIKWCEDRGLDPNDPNNQMSWAFAVLRDNPSGYQRFLDAKDAGEAAVVFEQEMERAGNPALSVRKKDAREIEQAFNRLQKRLLSSNHQRAPQSHETARLHESARQQVAARLISRWGTRIVGNPQPHSDLKHELRGVKIDDAGSCYIPKDVKMSVLNAYDRLTDGNEQTGHWKITIWNIISGHSCDGLEHPEGGASDIGAVTDLRTGETTNFYPGTPGYNPTVVKNFRHDLSIELPKGSWLGQASFGGHLAPGIGTGWDAPTHQHFEVPASAH